MEITLRSPLDMHVHLRDGALLDITVPATSKTFSGALVMPNLDPPLTTLEAVSSYKKAIEAKSEGDNFTPYMTLFFSPSYTREFLGEARKQVLAIKLYPRGVTTHSGEGVSSPLEPASMGVLESMEELGIPLSVHGETPGFVLEREALFLPIYDELARSFPRLKIVMEHITTRELVEFIGRYENVFATVTLHHLLITLDDVIGGALDPHNFSKPIAKTPRDREALRELVLSGHSGVMFGSDSAPHPRGAKESCSGAAGIFHAPIALQMLAEIFEEAQCVDNIEGFVSENAKRIYGIEPPGEKTVVLEKKGFRVPEAYGDVVPFARGKTIGWSIGEIR